MGVCMDNEREKLFDAMNKLLDNFPILVKMRNEKGIEIYKKYSNDMLHQIVEYLINKVLPTTQLNKKQFADRIGVSQQLITEWSKGRAIPSAQLLFLMILELDYLTKESKIN